MPYKDKEKQKKFLSDWHLKNKNKDARRESLRKSKKVLIERNKALILESRSRGCQVCGYNKCQEALEFHHSDPNTKDLKISDALKQWGTDKLKEEINKCIVLCCNCHREAHYLKP